MTKPIIGESTTPTKLFEDVALARKQSRKYVPMKLENVEKIIRAMHASRYYLEKMRAEMRWDLEKKLGQGLIRGQPPSREAIDTVDELIRLEQVILEMGGRIDEPTKDIRRYI